MLPPGWTELVLPDGALLLRAADSTAWAWLELHGPRTSAPEECLSALAHRFLLDNFATLPCETEATWRARQRVLVKEAQLAADARLFAVVESVLARTGAAIVAVDLSTARRTFEWILLAIESIDRASGEKSPFTPFAD